MIEAIKLSKEKPLTSLKPAPSYTAESRSSDLDSLTDLSPQNSRLFFYLTQCNIPEATPPRRLPKVLQMKKVAVKPALSTTGSSGASSLFSSLSHLSNIVITAAVFQHCQHNILNKKMVRVFNIALTVKDINTGTRKTTIPKKFSLCWILLKLIMY